jgi:hypothetical protein
MKKLLVSILFVGGSLIANAQSKFNYSDSVLVNASKEELVKIYMAHVNTTIDSAPYAVWGISDNYVDLPRSKYVKRKRAELAKLSAKHTKANTELMYDVIYYADKESLLKAILYIRNVNQIISK